MSNSSGMLRSFVERIERLKAEIDDLNTDVRDVYAEAKSAGFDKTALGQVVAIRRKREKDGEKLETLSALVELYLSEIDGPDLARGVQSRAHTHEDTTPGPTPLRPATGGQGTHADAARPTGGGPDMLGQASEAGQEAGGASNGVPAPAPQRTLSEIAGGYRPAPIRKAPVTDDDLDDDAWIAMRFGGEARP
jgi:uncharacterized protein (UPF0335 family)